MENRQKIELVFLIGAALLWYSTLPQEIGYTKCHFNAKEPQVLADCQNKTSVIDGLSANGQGLVALNITRDMLNIFEHELGTYREKSQFGAKCASQSKFYWLELVSVHDTESSVSRSLSQIYASFPGTSMDGSGLEKRIPMIKTGAASNQAMDLSHEPRSIEGVSAYIPRLADCSSFRFQLHYDLDDQKTIESKALSSIHRIEIPDAPKQEVEVSSEGLRLTFRLKSSEAPKLAAERNQLHDTYSFDNQLLLVGDVFHRSIALRFEQIRLPVLTSAFIIDFHDRVLPHFTKGSPQLWQKTIADFNFAIDSGIVQGAVPNGLQKYYIN